MQAAPLPHHTNQRAGRFMHNFVIIRPIPLGCTQPFPTTEMPTERHESKGPPALIGLDGLLVATDWAARKPHALHRGEFSHSNNSNPCIKPNANLTCPPSRSPQKTSRATDRTGDPDSMRCRGARARSFLLLIACGSGRGPLRLWLEGTRGHRGKVEKSSQPQDVRRLDRKNPPSWPIGQRHWLARRGAREGTRGPARQQTHASGASTHPGS
jgi:hypothetical protein